MNGKALGIIETVGFVPAVEAGDVAVKTADVSLIGSQVVGGGLVSILFAGDVAAVKASVDAGSTAAARIGTVHSVTVIARTAEGLDGILIEEEKRPACYPGRTATAAVLPEIILEIAEEPDDAPAPADEPEPLFQESPDEADEGAVAGEGDALSFDMTELKKLKVTKLRRLARQLPSFSIARGEIKYAKKKDLLEAFTTYIKTLT